jgi:sialate O-acetylesterase
MDADPAVRSIMVDWREQMKTYPERKAAWDVAFAEWKKENEKAKNEGRKSPDRPEAPRGPSDTKAPRLFYNGMIHPLAPFALRGAIWYQGESNRDHAETYEPLLRVMIRSWRNRWGQGDFAFGIVQLPDFGSVTRQPVDESKEAIIREAQAQVAMTLPNCGLAVLIDGGEGEVHPKNKQLAGKRLARWALATQYGQKMEWSGPVFDAMKIEGGRARITFAHVGSGLETKGGEALKGFALAGADGNFVWAEAIIEGDSVVVWSNKIAEPKAVRYAWSRSPACNLINKEGLPAVPFRTDRK